MKIRKAYRVMLITPLLLGFALTARAQGGWFGGGDDTPRPSLVLQPSEITLAGPTPMDGQNLLLLLSLPNGLGELQKQATDRFRTHLQAELRSNFAELLSDEDIPLVKDNGDLVLASTVDISIRQKIRDVMKSSRYDTEKGSLKIYGQFRYSLKNDRGTLVDEQVIDLGALDVERRYVTRTPPNGGRVEDTTGPAVEKALSHLAGEIADRLEVRFEAETLQQLARQIEAP